MIHCELEWFRTYVIERFCVPWNWNWFRHEGFGRVSAGKTISQLL
jgi:hypothetical protein